jgi:hypothetical protein
MVTISNVWDRATDVVRGRMGQMAGIAALTLFLPQVVQSAVPLFTAPGSTAFALGVGLLAIAAGALAIWGQLALLATASDPSATQSDAYARATARFPAALAVTIVAVLAVVVLFIPFVVAVGLSGADFSGMANTGQMPDIGGGTIAFIALYALALLIVGLAVTARLFLTNAVVLNERRGLGAFARSWQLTSGLTWRLVGVLLLYGIVVGIATSAARFLTGAVFGLALGRTATTTFLAATASSAVATVFSVLAAAFVAQLYVAVTDRGVAAVFE